MTRPVVLRSDAEPWQKVHPSVRNQVSIMRWFGVSDYMKEATLDEVISTWYYVQGLKFDELEQQRVQAESVAAWKEARAGK